MQTKMLLLKVARSICDAVRTVDDIVDYTKRNRLPGILI